MSATVVQVLMIVCVAYPAMLGIVWGVYRLGILAGRRTEREVVTVKLCQWAKQCVDSRDCALLVRAAKCIRAAKATFDV
jgi:hypothetical protein